jgi:hypothetical protein
MKVKVYKVMPKYGPKSKNIFYMVDAPNFIVAKWCGANLLNNEYGTCATANDMVAVRIKSQER